jgi:UDP-N-acetylglucosamine--N-acetylmuramyl-(pentapeptide) pyrophosphoryl-undecaprenol N-acetylglucosamine transferase
MKVFIAAGGTGGHVYPALSVARRFKENCSDIFWLGKLNSLEETIADEENFNFIPLVVSGFLGKSFLIKFKTLISIFIAFCKVSHHLIKQKPDLMFVTGGYLSVAPGLAAYCLGVPLFVHEQNSVAGLSNRLLDRFSRLTFEGFPESFKRLKVRKLTGNPVREEISQYKKQRARGGKKFNILVIGGSQGSSQLNELVLGALKNIDNISDLSVMFQVGVQEFDMMQEKCSHIESNIHVRDYIDNMGEEYANSDLVISRAGAMAISEICFLGKPSILLPLPWAADNHQYFNALYVKNLGAAELIESSFKNSNKLAMKILELKKDDQKRTLMGEQAKIAFNFSSNEIYKSIDESLQK